MSKGILQRAAKRHPTYPVISPLEDSGPPPPEEHKLKELLVRMPKDDVYKLVLLMYLGRGDFGTDEMATHFETIRDRFPNVNWAISQLMGKAPLADYLTDALAELKKAGIDLDDLEFTSVNSGN